MRAKKNLTIMFLLFLQKKIIMQYRSTCPLSSFLDIIGDKWSLLIIRDLFIGRNTYSEFLKSPENISTNVLVDRVKKLIAMKIITFERDQNDKKIKYYKLTKKGIDLFPIITEMSLWSRNHLDMEFHPLAIETFNEIDQKGKLKHINDVVTSFNNELINF